MRKTVSKDDDSTNQISWISWWSAKQRNFMNEVELWNYFNNITLHSTIHTYRCEASHLSVPIKTTTLSLESTNDNWFFFHNKRLSSYNETTQHADVGICSCQWESIWDEMCASTMPCWFHEWSSDQMLNVKLKINGKTSSFQFARTMEATCNLLIVIGMVMGSECMTFRSLGNCISGGSNKSPHLSFWSFLQRVLKSELYWFLLLMFYFNDAHFKIDLAKNVFKPSKTSQQIFHTNTSRELHQIILIFDFILTHVVNVTRISSRFLPHFSTFVETLVTTSFFL